MVFEKTGFVNLRSGLRSFKDTVIQVPGCKNTAYPNEKYMIRPI